jgi:choline-sulfatase
LFHSADVNDLRDRPGELDGRPNILLVMCDQLSALATPAYGNAVSLMPELEALAARGTLFERAYCNAPLCAPSRASMLTGQLAGRLPVTDNGEELPASVPTFVHHLRDAGYRTALSGKMHFVGPDQLHGFEERLTTDIYPSDILWIADWDLTDDGPEHPLGAETMARNLRSAGSAPWTAQMSYDVEVQHRSLEHIRRLARREDGRPWFLCVSFTQPHDPYNAQEEYWQRYEGLDVGLPGLPPPGYSEHTADVWAKRGLGLERLDVEPEAIKRARRGYYGMASFVDDCLGELGRTLRQVGEDERTIVIFTSDHGEMLGEHGLWGKCTWREWSSRVPLVAAGPGIESGARIAEVVSLVDMFRTLLELADAEGDHSLDDLLPQDGRSLVPLLRGESVEEWPDRALIENLGPQTKAPLRAVATARFKYVYLHGEEELLFDLESDPDEWVDLAVDPVYAETVARLRQLVLADWDPDAVQARVIASQRRRRMLRSALAKGRRTAWDYRPTDDVAERWVRPRPEKRESWGWSGELGAPRP